MSNSPHRSFEKIETADLARLADLAVADFNALFDRRPLSGVYRGRCFLICLCQGAAQHFLHHDRGVQDFDVWAFFNPHASMPFPPRRRGIADFGLSRFGKNPDDGEFFVGRRVDIMARSIEIGAEEDEVQALQRYLREKGTRTAWCLSRRPAIVIWPPERRGEIAWGGDEIQPPRSHD